MTKKVVLFTNLFTHTTGTPEDMRSASVRASVARCGFIPTAYMSARGRNEERAELLLSLLPPPTGQQGTTNGQHSDSCHPPPASRPSTTTNRQPTRNANFCRQSDHYCFYSTHSPNALSHSRLVPVSMQLFKPISLVKNLPLNIECLSAHSEYPMPAPFTLLLPTHPLTHQLHPPR